MVQNLRAYFMLHVITIKWMMSVKEKIELTGTSKDQGWARLKFQENLSLLQRKSSTKIWQESFLGWQKAGHGYGPDLLER